MTPDRPDPYEFEERAAILEFDAGLSRDEAEKEARRMLAIPPEGARDDPRRRRR